MRQIKFRAWDSKGEYFKPLEDDGDYYFRDDGDGLCLYDKWGECKDTILLQFTGLKDKNGKEIYEGDILDFEAREWGAPDFKSAVEWDIESASWCFGGGLASDVSVYRQVIGNIYENSHELIK